MTGLQAFATFGLPAIAICAALVGLRATRKNAERIMVEEKQSRSATG